MSVMFQSSQQRPDQDHTFVLVGKWFKVANKTSPREQRTSPSCGGNIIAPGTLKQGRRKAPGKRERGELLTGKVFQEV